MEKSPCGLKNAYVNVVDEGGMVRTGVLMLCRVHSVYLGVPLKRFIAPDKQGWRTPRIGINESLSAGRSVGVDIGTYGLFS